MKKNSEELIKQAQKEVDEEIRQQKLKVIKGYMKDLIHAERVVQELKKSIKEVVDV